MDNLIINSEKIRYIKLGEGNRDAKYCINNGVMTLGFWTNESDMFNHCMSANWTEVEGILFKKRKELKNGKDPRSVRDDLRQVREFFEAMNETIWLTFDDRKLYWGKCSDSIFSIINENNMRGCQRTMSIPWKSEDLIGNPLYVDDIAGHVSMVSQYRGTICKIDDVEYVLRRLSGLTSKSYENISNTLASLHKDLEAVIKSLTPKDFELLVEMIFVNSGWTRVGFAGRTEYLIDLILSRPSVSQSTDEMVAVQVKSKTDQKEYEQYEYEIGQTYQNAFYVYHTGSITRMPEGKMKLIDATTLAPMVVKSGLIQWLLNRIK